MSRAELCDPMHLSDVERQIKGLSMMRRIMQFASRDIGEGIRIGPSHDMQIGLGLACSLIQIKPVAAEMDDVSIAHHVASAHQ